MRIVAMNCPNCGGKLKADSTSGQLICESCKSLLMIEYDALHSPNENLKAAREAEEKELQDKLDLYKQKIEGYKARGVIDPIEVQSINRRHLTSILAISPENKSAKRLQGQLSAIKSVSIQGINMYMKLNCIGIFSIIRTDTKEVIYSKPLEQVSIFSFFQPLFPLPGKVILGTPDEKTGQTITFEYLESEAIEVERLLRYISKVAKVPSPEQQQPKPTIFEGIFEKILRKKIE